MDSNPLLSIIIPVYNVEKYIQRCAESLFNQTLKTGIEFIFINDATTDKSIEVLKECIENFPERKNQIKIINHLSNKGLSAARLSGLKEAKGHYIGWCDSDDWVESEMYTTMLETALKENVEIVSCGVIHEMPTNKKDILKFKDQYCNQKLSVDQIFNLMEVSVLWCSLSLSIVKKSLYYDNNIFPIESIHMWEDVVTTFRLRAVAKETILLPQAFYHYDRSRETMSSHLTNSKIWSKINAASTISEFVKNMGHKFDIINELKFQSKIDFFWDNENRDLQTWKNIFPESIHNVSSFKSLNKKWKIYFTLAKKLPFLMYLPIPYLSSRLKKYLIKF